jgi:hypothetical protein
LTILSPFLIHFQQYIKIFIFREPPAFASYRGRKEKGETSKLSLAGSPQNLFLELASILNFCLK